MREFEGKTIGIAWGVQRCLFGRVPISPFKPFEGAVRLVPPPTQSLQGKVVVAEVVADGADIGLQMQGIAINSSHPPVIETIWTIKELRDIYKRTIPRVQEGFFIERIGVPCIAPLVVTKRGVG